MDETIEKTIGYISKYGWQPVAAGLGLLIALRLSQPAIVASAVGRVYGDVCKALGVWWGVHREWVDAKRDRERAAEARDRALEAAYMADAEKLAKGSRRGALELPRRSARGTDHGNPKLEAVKATVEDGCCCGADGGHARGRGGASTDTGSFRRCRADSDSNDGGV